MPGDRIGHAVRQVHAGVAEADAGIGAGEQHLAARLVVARVVRRARTRYARHHLACACAAQMSLIGLAP